MQLKWLAIGIALACAGAVTAEQPAIKKIPLSNTSASSGKEMFSHYCASCHGMDGKGAGPAAAALKNQVADLTLLSKQHGGTFPRANVVAVLRGQAMPVAHGSAEMPVWGPLLNSLSSNQQLSELRISNLASYVETLQAK